MERRFGRKLETSVVVVPELIGGIRVVVGDEVLDTSIKRPPRTDEGGADRRLSAPVGASQPVLSKAHQPPAPAERRSTCN